MSRFVRNLLIAVGGLYLLAQFVEAYQRVPVFEALSLNPGFHRFAFAWQWLTFPFVQLPSDVSLLNVAISLMVASFVLPDVERSYGRTPLVLALLSGWFAAGVVGTACSFLFPVTLPVSGFGYLLGAVLAFMLWNRRMTTLTLAFPTGTSTGISLTAKQFGLAMVGFSLLSFLIVRQPIHLAADLAAMLGGLVYAVLRERRAARTLVRHSFTVIRGGKSDRTLH